MSIENEIAGLTQSTTDLLEAVNTKKSTLDTAVSNAQTAVTDATSQVSLAAAEKVGAQTARDTAETFKDQAYTYSQSAASAVAYQDLTAIAQTKAESAVDVFVYDTSKDSDGGAWRQRTQGTSWYNEPLNTSTRGSRKEFPAVAVIVATSPSDGNQVRILDGDDPSLPVWMIITDATGGAGHIGTKTSISAVNGKMVFGIESQQGLRGLDFVSDTIFAYKGSATAGASGFSPNPISLRNEVVDVNSWSKGFPGLVDADVNDVAMTVLPDAPIDPATGLPIPTIAVATNGGVSVIKDDGTVVDSGFTSNSTWVTLDNETIYYESGNTAEYQLISTLVDGFTGYDLAKSLVTTPIYAHGTITTRCKALLGSNTLAVGSEADGGFSGLGIYSKTKDAYNYNSLAVLDESYKQAIITSDYNTGWMNGDIKLATLSDTDDTDLVGSELVTNGTFDSGTTGWTGNSNTTLSVVSGALRITTVAAGIAAATYQSFTTVIGQKYTVTMESVTNIGNGGIYLRVGSNPEGGSSLNISTLGKYSVTFTATSTTTFVTALIGTSQTAGEYKDIDNISVRLAEADRSVNGNGLQVFGTVQKSPVATGADLVAYSGFSSSNYLMQPYNSDLDFGTGDFCISYWMYKAASSFPVFSRASGTGTAYGDDPNYFSHFIDTNLKIRMAGGNIDAPVSTLGIVDYTWAKIDVVRREGVAYVYVNGVQKFTQSYETPDVSCPDLPMYLGALYYNYFVNAGIGNKLALFRISGTAPTAEQIEKIYNDEKVLFQENAKATLHGTSDAVTALAYDEDTELLHAGTSSGRSVFQGLRRVDNTTDAVGVAISASNGLIVEE